MDPEDGLHVPDVNRPESVGTVYQNIDSYPSKQVDSLMEGAIFASKKQLFCQTLNLKAALVRRSF